ncbi:class I SAM-dependent methyltransferase [Bailinhaonella thermotolerans]|uniref:Class I SAM-dependent methyltransferase n=1 Tax=Bailinhaonella thermotolerans TaxID=1070861 RepID=A0A3A4BCM6_9ACTN|nr:class I SAM-dependent methyltransferase [Bailinhaonella thermotolerans]RJL35856.1 class I SAM-dependent methyltransferase [Bailinhaonella thermotolerans]
MSMAETAPRETWASGDYRPVGAQFLPAAELLCEALRLRAGERVLDVATGTGNTALAAARRWGRVTALDLVPDLLAHARRRADAEGLTVEFLEGDAQALPLPDASFDVVTSTFGVMFAPDQARAAAELTRVVRPGGRIGLACWTPEGYMGRMLALNPKYVPPAPGHLPESRWGTRDGLAELFPAAADIATTRREVLWRFPSPAEHVRVWSEVYGPTVMALRALDEPGRAALLADLTTLVEELDTSDDDTLLMPLEYLEIVITLP